MNLREIIDMLNKDVITAKDILQFNYVTTKFDNNQFDINVSTNSLKFKVTESEWNLHSKIILRPGDVKNLDTTVTTTIGRAIANRMLKIEPFGILFKYDNEKIDINEFINDATNYLMRGAVTTLQMTKMFNNMVWLTRFADMILPSLSRNILVTPKASVEFKKQLLEKNADVIENKDISYVDKVEKPLLKNIIDNLKDDPSFMLYNTGKPSVGNNLKQSIGTFSPIFDPTTGKYNIPDGNLVSGHSTELYHSMANMNITGTYGRAVQTQDGGSIVKSLYNSMNNIKAGPVGSNCKTTLFKRVKLTEDNASLYVWNYMDDGNRLILLTPENINTYIGKVCRFRSSLFCKYENKFEICNICAGELPYKTNLLSIGSLTARVGFQFVKNSLKGFHDSTIKLTNINPLEYMKIVD